MMLSKKWLGLPGLSLVVLLFAGVAALTGQDAPATWQDSATGLVWTAGDGGSNMNWEQAGTYCSGLTLEGHEDWRLPSMDELKTLYDRSSKKTYKVKGPIELGIASIWSADVNSTGDAWSLSFLNGSSNLSPARGSCGGSARALCVRGAAK